MLVVVAVLAAVTVYEALVALGVIGISSLPGEGRPGGEIVGVVTALGLVAALVVAGVLGGLGQVATRLSALLAPSAAAFLVTHFYTFDPYYAPRLNRYSTAGMIPPIAVFIIAGLATAAGVLTWAPRSVGLVASGLLILACGVTVWLAGVGH